MLLVVVLLSGQIQRPAEAGVALLVTGGWTVWLMLAAVRRTGRVLAVDLGIAIALRRAAAPRPAPRPARGTARRGRVGRDRGGHRPAGGGVA
jgi:hypothetical protein